MSDPTEQVDLSDPVSVAKRGDKAKTREARRADGFKKLAESADGRLWLWDLLSNCGLFRTSLNESVVTMAANEGQRNIGLTVMRDLTKYAPDAYLLMTKENSDG